MIPDFSEEKRINAYACKVVQGNWLHKLYQYFSAPDFQIQSSQI